ncbi:tetratricopeptide repeat protein [Paenibacillus barengoltzii]|uniref:tetratricopeptide repeat protein n=1 Tax=Paenibacillus barengoltzii TaxID=343517 RepID=UPI003F8A068A
MKVFLSHSSKDKVIVEKVWSRLGPKCSWLDKVEIDTGEIILEKISNGIEKATDFLLFWSEFAAKSSWVRLELHMAFIRYLDDNGCRLRVVCLDETELPLYLRPFLFMKLGENIDEFLQNLESMLLTRAESRARRSKFVNRTNELGRIETAIDDDDIRIITLFGIHGIGKKSVVKRVKDILFEEANFVGIQVKPGLDLVALSLELASKAKETIPPLFKNEMEVKKFLAKVIEILHSKGFIIAFFDIQYWLEEEGDLGKELEFLFELVQGTSAFHKRPLFFTTTRHLVLGMEFAKYHQTIRLEAINEDHLVTIINNNLEIQTGRTEEKEKIIPIARMLFGYPLAARIIASMIDKYGAEHLINFPSEIVNLRVDIAKYLLGEIKLSHNAVRLLETISLVDGPLPGEDIAQVLEFDDELFRSTVDEALSAGLLTHDEGFFKVHPLVQDYYFRSISNGAGFLEFAGKVAIIAKERLQSFQVGSPFHSKLLPCVFRLVALSGDYKEAISLRSDLLGYLGQVVKDLYDSREYKLALQYAELIIGNNPDNWNVRLYSARCLIRLDRAHEAEPVLLQMNKERPKDVTVLHALGRLEMSRNQWEPALKWFSLAITERGDHLPSIRDSAECYYQLGDLTQSEGYVRRAKEIDAMNPFVLQVESKIFEERGDYDSAYYIMSRALSLDKNNPSFNHRMGRIAELKGDTDAAKEHYTMAIKTDSKFFESRLSLVNLKIDLFEFDGVEDELDALEKIVPGRKQDVLRNVRAKFLINYKDDLNTAAKLVDINIKYSREPHSFAIRARIEIMRSELQRSLGYFALSEQHIKNALQIISSGKEIFGDNKILIQMEKEVLTRLGIDENEDRVG